MRYITATALFTGIILLGQSCILDIPPADTDRMPPPATSPSTQTASGSPAIVSSGTTINSGTISSGSFVAPINWGDKRVTKKTFWLKVSPGDSPVSPEKFAGYHTGVDFETISSEQDEEIAVYAVCTGALALKKWATGYGGVAVQQCRLDGQDVTIVYGHLKLESILPTLGSTIGSGERIGILGKGFSKETDGERKHLHFSIHKGSRIDIRGYVSTPAELGWWLDPLEYF